MWGCIPDTLSPLPSPNYNVAMASPAPCFGSFVAPLLSSSYGLACCLTELGLCSITFMAVLYRTTCEDINKVLLPSIEGGKQCIPYCSLHRRQYEKVSSFLFPIAYTLHSIFLHCRREKSEIHDVVKIYPITHWVPSPTITQHTL